MPTDRQFWIGSAAACTLPMRSIPLQSESQCGARAITTGGAGPLLTLTDQVLCWLGRWVGEWVVVHAHPASLLSPPHDATGLRCGHAAGL